MAITGTKSRIDNVKRAPKKGRKKEAKPEGGRAIATKPKKSAEDQQTNRKAPMASPSPRQTRTPTPRKTREPAITKFRKMKKFSNKRSQLGNTQSENLTGKTCSFSQVGTQKNNNNYLMNEIKKN